MEFEFFMNFFIEREKKISLAILLVAIITTLEVVPIESFCILSQWGRASNRAMR